ncbi:MAG: SDR family oxidoreductase [Bacteroidota bacterium]
MKNSKIAIITGGSRGLGRNAALSLADHGNDVLFTYHSNQQAAEEVKKLIESKGQKAAFLQLDTGRTASFAHFVNAVKSTLQDVWQTKTFDFLINNAGVGAHAPIGETTEATFDRLMNVQFKGVYFLTQSLLPLMNDGGRIVNISTGLTRFALPGYAAYASMKGAIEVFTKYLAKELGPRKITANLVAPGAIDNDFNKHAFANKNVTDFIASQTALGRVGKSDDIGKVVNFLVSDAASWVNAQRLEASGGMFL